MTSSAAVIDAFQSAKRDFVANFPEGAKYNVSQYPTIEDVYQTTQSIQAQQASTRTMRNLAKNQPFLETLQQFNHVVKTFVQVKPELLALIWGPIKWLLMVSSTFLKCYDKVVQAMAQIGASLPAFQMYTDLFEGNSRIQHVLCLFFQDILDFHATLLGLFKHQTWSILFESLWPRYYGKVKVILDNIAQHRMLMDSEVTLANITEEVKARRIALDKYEADQEYQQRQEFNMMENLLSPIYYDQQLEHISRNCTTSTGDWLRAHNDFQCWIDHSNSDVDFLWLQGIPGAGKTYISSIVARQLQCKGAPMAFAFLSYHSAEPVSALKVLQSFLFQLASYNDDLRTCLIETYNSNSRQLRFSTDFTRSVLTQLLIALPTTYIIADGLDEVSEQERTLLLRSFLDLQTAMRKENKTLKVLLGSRAEDDIARTLAAKPRVLRVHDNNSLDIAAYVDQRATTWLDSQWAPPRVVSRIRELMRPISTRARGMFLYARLVCDSIVLTGDIDSVQHAVENLPDGLNEVYGRVISRIEESLSNSEREEAKLILGLVATSYVPLSVYEFRLAIFTSQGKDPSRGCQDLFLNVLQRCGAILEEVDGKIYFVHFTLHEYLHGSQSNSYLNEGHTHREITAICIRYLSSPCFEPTLCPPVLTEKVLSGAYVLENYACTYWLEHLKRVSTQDMSNLDPLLEQFVHLRRNANHYEASLSQTLKPELFKTKQDFIQKLLLEAHNFAERRSREFCFTDSLKWQDRDPFVTSGIQSRVRDTLESLLCVKTPHQQGCHCAALKTLYGDHIFKCGRPGCHFHRLGFHTQIERDRHMESHTRPYKCVHNDCPFSDFGFRTQALLAQHVKDLHSQGITTTAMIMTNVINRDEFKFILQDAVRQGDLELIRGNWEQAERYGSDILLTAIEESPSLALTEYLAEKVELHRDLVTLRKLFLAAIDNKVVTLFEKYSVQELVVSYKGEKSMIGLLHRAAATRSPEVVEAVWKQIPPVLDALFVASVIPARPDQQAETAAIECLDRIFESAPLDARLQALFEAGLRALCTRCCALPIAVFILEELRSLEHNGFYSDKWPIHNSIHILIRKDTLENAKLIQFLMGCEYYHSAVYFERSLQLLRNCHASVGAKNIHNWLGRTWVELIDSNLPGKVNPQKYITQTLGQQGPWTGWQAEVPIQDRAIQIGRLVNGLLSLRPPVEPQRAIEVALNFERKEFTAQDTRENYQREVDDKLSKIREHTQRQSSGDAAIANPD